jgi:hypothetical protein
MTFDWMEPKRNPMHVKTLAAKREAMYRGELADRAALLQRLGHDRGTVRARLAANIQWDFEAGASPIPGGDLDAIVDRAFGAARATPKPKGGSK